MSLQPNSWSCLPTAFSYVLDTPLSNLLKLIGHDGSEIIWPDRLEPFRRRGFHEAELIYAAHKLGYSVTSFEVSPYISEGEYEYDLPNRLPLVLEIMQNSKGVLIGETDRGMPHALGWNNQKVFDPSGRVESLEGFSIDSYFRIQSTENNFMGK